MCWLTPFYYHRDSVVGYCDVSNIRCSVNFDAFLQEVAQNAILLTHWGRRDGKPRSSSRYMADDWTADWRADSRAPSGKKWSFPGGSRSMIGEHPCYVAGKDIVIPVFSPPSKWANTPWLSFQPAERTIFAYFSGNLAEREPLKYSRGIRHRIRSSFRHTKGWKLVGNQGMSYSTDLSSSEFCLVPPGGDGWSSRVDDSVRHGCIPVIIMDNVHMPFETELDYSSFAVRINESDVEKADEILRSIPSHTREHMREAMRHIWLRFTYAQALLDADAFAKGSPSSYLDVHPIPELARAVAPLGRGAPDALDTIMMTLYGRL